MCGLPFYIFARNIFILQNNISLEYYWILKKTPQKNSMYGLNYIAKERQGKRLGLARTMY